MNKKIKKGLVAFVASAALILGGCSSAAPDLESGDSSDAQAPAEITLLAFQTPNLTEQWWEDYVAGALEGFPNLTVNIEYTPDLDRQGYAKQLLASGTLPDVIWDVPVNDFVAAGALLPYDAADLSALDVPAGTGEVDGEVYSLSIGAQVVPLVYYNKDIFAELNLDVPTTREELNAVAQAIHDAGETPFLIGGAGDAWTTTLLLNGMLNSEILGENPSWVADRVAGEVQFSDPNVRSVVEEWLSLFESGFFNDDALSIDYSQLVAAFAAGEGAMYPMGSWAATTEAEFNVGAFPLPAVSGEPVLGINYGQGMFISAETDYPAQAQAFAIALATNAAGAAAWVAADAIIPVLEGVDIPADAPSLLAETISVYAGAGGARVQPFFSGSGANTMPTGMSAEWDKGVQGLLLGGSITDFLTKMDQTFDDLNS